MNRGSTVAGLPGLLENASWSMPTIKLFSTVYLMPANGVAAARRRSHPLRQRG